MVGDDDDTGLDDGAAPGPVRRARPVNETLDSVAALLRRDEPAGADAPGTDAQAAAGAPGDAEEPAPQPRTGKALKSLDDAAKGLGVDPAKLYGLEIKLADGETVTLGALKDAYQGRADKARESVQREVQLDARVAQVQQEIQLWAQAGQEVAARISPDVRERLVKAATDRQKAEWGSLLLDMPELADPVKREGFDKEVADLLQSRYGVKAAATRRVEVLILRDLLKAEKRLQEILSFVPKAKEPKPGKAPQGRGAVSSTSIAGNSEVSRLDRIAGLMRGQ